MIWLLACDGGDDGPLAPDGPPTLVAAGSATVELSWPDVAFAPDGTLWVSWATFDEADRGDVFVASSTDGGRTFSDPIRVDDTDQLFLGSVRQPMLAVDGERVAVAVGGGSQIASSILLYTAPADAPVFSGRVIDQGVRGPDEEVSIVDQPEVAFDATGSLWVNWKRGTFLDSFQLVLARESEGFAVGRLEDGAPGQPCECCPTDFHAYPDGEMLVAFRNNDLNVRDIWLAWALPGGGFEASVPLSTTGWVVLGCPFDGPSLAETPDGVLVAIWADASLGDSDQWMATSTDRGRTWTPSFQVEPTNEESVTWPTVAAAPDGTVWTSVEQLYDRTLLHSTTDLGTTFTAHDADAPTGPLFFAELAAGPDGVGMVGVTEEGELWYLAVSR